MGAITVNSTDEYKVSVIVPIYNVEKYLRVCIDSILKQTYKNLEIILVDDGSTDKSGDICDNYREKDERIIVIHNFNGGLSAARNCGIEKSSGEFITCIDSDDYVDINFIENFMQAISEYDADAVISDYIKVSDDNAHAAGKSSQCTIMSNTDCLKYLYKGGFHGISAVAWGKIFKRSTYLENNIRYPVGKIHEDIFTTYKLIYNSPKVVYVDSKSYFYRVRDNSIMHGFFSIKNLDALEGTSEAIDFYKENGETEIESLAINYHMRLTFGLNYKLRHSDASKDLIDQYTNKMKEDAKKYLIKGHISEPRRLLFRFIASCPMDYILKKVGV